MAKESVIIFADNIHHGISESLSIKGETIGIYSFEQAHAHLQELEADLILIDCGSNHVQGLSLLKKAKRSHPDVPVLFLAAGGSEELAVKAFRAGVRDYLPKPVDISELRSIITSLLKLKRSSREKRSPFRKPSSDRVNLSFAVSTNLPSDILKAISYIEENFSEKINLADCARAASLSSYHFCRKFKKFTGMTPMKFVTQLRINKAKALLAYEDMNITEVSEHVGFSDSSVFCAQFKKLTGLNPREFKKSAHKKNTRR
jgi:YesN/AraC family two-component response regulator